MKKISIIIPVYNVEKYVEKCIQSCVNQNVSISDFEIIVINDGSTDSSLDVVNKVVENASNVSVFSQKNLGLSEARNKGLSLSQGEYIWFIDSDDWIAENCLADIIGKLKEIEVLALGYIEAYDDVTKNNKVLSENIIGSAGIELLQKNYIVPAQFYIYRKNFLIEKKLFFEPGIFHEDFEFTPRMLYFAKKISVYEKLVYYFYKRPNSITTSVNPKKSFDLLYIALSLIDFEKKNVDANLKPFFHNMIWLAINNALHNSLVMDKIHRKKLDKVFFNNKWIFNYLDLTTINKYKLERILFVKFPYYTKIYKFLTYLK